MLCKQRLVKETRKFDALPFLFFSEQTSVLWLLLCSQFSVSECGCRKKFDPVILEEISFELFLEDDLYTS